ncbi:MAG: T9SS type A sorting domain-containing protein [Candidatus Marinimicrobia bacterium]|nr:T9SS type A sorting domain-containing protein [Candidatus Neomarinimicrobiota bacterium]
MINCLSHQIKVFTLLITLSLISGQSVPTTFHFSPPLDGFQAVRVVGSFNGWNNADNTFRLYDNDGDGEYTLTAPLPINVTHNYKFVLDADWGQAFTDPDNPLINTSDNNNSILNTTDPMITYFLPRDITSSDDMFVDTTTAGLPIRVVLNHSGGNPIDLSSIILEIDDNSVDDPSQYYDETNHQLIYQPNEPPSVGEHTLFVSVTSDAGTVTKSSTYLYEPNLVIYTKPTTFYFDANSSRHSYMQTINSVSLMGTFNNWNNQFNPMQDDDGDGVWETTIELEENTWDYKFQLNYSFWTVDWDNPNFNPDNPNNNIISVIPDSNSSIILEEPSQGKIFQDGSSNVQFISLLDPGVFGEGIDESTIQLLHNGNSINFEFLSTTNKVVSNIDFSQSDFDHIEISFTNNVGNSAYREFTYGNYPENSGFHFVDAIHDQTYDVPFTVNSDGLDIKSFHITSSPTFDKLQFLIEMMHIDDRTRLGLLITNPVTSLAEDSRNCDILLPDWENEGIFLSLSSPTSSLFNPDVENRIQENRNPETFGDVFIDIDETLLNENQFNFEIELMYLDSLLGGWNQDRNFILFSYLAEEDGSGNSFEITPNENGYSSFEDPDIYDAIFVRDEFWQKRILSNYFPVDHPYGPMLSSLDGDGRGIGTLIAEDISDSLATFGPVITFLTPSVTYWYPDLTVFGTIDDSLVTSAVFVFNGEENTINVNSNEFSFNVTLNEGDNFVSVQAMGSDGFEALSRELVLTYQKDHQPSVIIESSVNEGSIAFDAFGESPDSLGITYYWTSDSDNPSGLSFQGPPYLPSVTVSIPSVDGEYFINVLARDDANRTTTAQRRFLVEDGVVHIESIDEHANWIDDAIFYEIYPRSFTTQGGFSGIQSRIPDMVDLGINAIWLMPIYQGPTLHGYEITDYFNFEEDYGTAEEFQDLVNELHENDIRVILDFVVNHTSIQHHFMQNVFEYHQYSPWADFYIWDDIPGDSNYEYFFDWASLPNLNHNNEDVRKHFIKAAEYWVNQFDIDGYRCDVAWGVEQRNPLFWQEWREALKNIKPDVFLEAEASSSEYVYFENRFDSANDWDLRNKLMSAMNGTVSIDDLNDEIQRNYPDNALPFRFLENHDEVRIASYLDSERSKLGHTILLTTNGIPLIYSGGEVGELTTRDPINWTDPNNIRPYFKQLIDIRKNFIHQPMIHRLENTETSNVYSYASVSENHTVVTFANFQSGEMEIQCDLSSLPDEDGPYFLTNLIDGSIIDISPDNVGSLPITLNSFDAKIYYYANHTMDIDPVEEAIVGHRFRINQNYPNPFNNTTTIQFEMDITSKTMIQIFNILGEKVVTIHNDIIQPGSHIIHWSGKDQSGVNVPSGLYFYRIQSNNRVLTKKMMLLK